VAPLNALRLDPQNVRSLMDVETKDQSPRDPTSDRLEIADQACAKRSP
jgi:hypothetical protein